MEDEILKHSMKAFREMKNKEHSLWQKVKEISVEIFIIVFAVTLSIWLHSWDEHRQEQKEVKEFLSDLKEDLQLDIQSMKSTKDSITKKNNDYYRFLNTDEKDPTKNSSVSFSTSLITTKISNGDYEGFKSSGKIGFIENKQLKKNILQYYQESTPNILELEKANTSEILKIMDYVIEKIAVENGKSMYGDKRLKLMLKLYLDESETIKSNYDDAMQQANNMIKEIDKENK